MPIVAVWVVRFGLSLAGAPASRYFSVTWVLVLGAVYYGVVVAKGFGSYRQLYPLNLIQSLVAEGLVALGIAIRQKWTQPFSPLVENGHGANAQRGSTTWSKWYHTTRE
ncbi:MAG: hypothetical protein BMS9Abin37_0879 [Acidobacteriota bacterium]|nr:MAG: hypothetical protein BMS9Abin37_0879 [Acidobacteriota bacterium]